MDNVEESEEDIEENHLGENCIENIWEERDSSVMLKKLHREGVKDENYGGIVGIMIKLCMSIARP